MNQGSPADQQHLAWLARSFGRPDYLPLRPEDLDALSTAGDIVERYPGTHLFKQGEQPLFAYLIQKGSVRLYRGQDADRRVVSRVGPGAVLGDIALFAGDPYISSAQAIERVTAFRFHREPLLRELAQRPALCLRWLVSGLRQLERTQSRVIHLLHKTVKEQVAELLLEEADARGDVYLSQSAMATLLGASRQSVNEALRDLREDGAVTTGYRVVRIVAPERLADPTSD